MLAKWNRRIGAVNWIFYALMRALIPGGMILHAFGFAYGGPLALLSLTLVGAASRWRRHSKERIAWGVLVAGMAVFLFDGLTFSQWMVLAIYGLWILNQQQLEDFLIPGAFGKAMLVSGILIFLAFTATAMVRLEETLGFVRWSIPLYFFLSALMLIRVNLMIVYRQSGGHRMNQEKNQLIFNGISMVLLLIGSFFLFSSWLPPAWTEGIVQGVGTVVGWILYPLAYLLAKGSVWMKKLILLFQSNRAAQESSAGWVPPESEGLIPREAITPYLEWAGWLVLLALLVLMIVVTWKRRSGTGLGTQMRAVEEKQFLSWEEIFHSEKVQRHKEKEVEPITVSAYRRLFLRWTEALNEAYGFVRPEMTPNQIEEYVEALGINIEDSSKVVDTYNRVRYRGDEATKQEEYNLENIVKDLEENQNIQ